MPTLRTYTTTTTTTTTTITTPAFIRNTSSVITTMAAEMMPSLAQELTRELSLSCPSPDHEMEIVARYHNHEVRPNQCCSVVIHRIDSPVETVWDLVRRFDEPQTYKNFLRSCRVIAGNRREVGCLREVHVVSGLPASSSTERLEVLDEESHAIGFRIIGGEHRLQNYRSVTTVHPSYASTHAAESHHSAVGGVSLEDGKEGTMVVESYVVDVPAGNTKQETCVFVDTIVRCNLQSLAKLAERMAARSSSSSSSTSSSSPSAAAPSSSSCKVS